MVKWTHIHWMLLFLTPLCGLLVLVTFILASLHSEMIIRGEIATNWRLLWEAIKYSFRNSILGPQKPGIGTPYIHTCLNLDGQSGPAESKLGGPEPGSHRQTAQIWSILMYCNSAQMGPGGLHFPLQPRFWGARMTCFIQHNFCVNISPSLIE